MSVISELSMRPLSAAQLGIWAAQMIDPVNPAYNTGEYFEILGPIDPRLFETALRRVVAETDALRLRLVESAEGPRQYAGADPAWVMPLVDVSATADPRAAAEAWMRDDMARAVDLTRGPLFGYALLRAGPERYFWYARYHHLCNDGFGLWLVARRVAAYYSALAEEGAVESDTPGPAWFDLVDDEEHYRLSTSCSEDREFWRGQLGSRPRLTTLSGKPPVRANGFIRRSRRLPSSLTEALCALGAARGAALSRVWIAGAALYLHRFTGAREVVVGLPVTARTEPWQRHAAGVVTNVLPLRLVIEPGDDAGTFLPRVSRCVREALAHQRYRVEDMRRDLGVRPDEPLYGTVVNVMSFDYDLRFGGHRGARLQPLDRAGERALDQRLRPPRRPRPTTGFRRLFGELLRAGARAPPAAFPGASRPAGGGARPASAAARGSRPRRAPHGARGLQRGVRGGTGGDASRAVRGPGGAGARGGRVDRRCRR